jgi:uncharacterized protein YkwD
MTRTRTFTARIALLATLVTSLSALVPAPAQAEGLTPRARMYRVTNHTRADFGVRRVGIHYTMSRLARQHSIAMANRGSIFHTANPVSYYLRGTSWRTWGENVGVTSSTVWSIQQAFLNSPPHRANILNRGFHRVAIGTYRDANGYLWVTVFFYG